VEAGPNLPTSQDVATLEDMAAINSLEALASLAGGMDYAEPSHIEAGADLVAGPLPGLCAAGMRFRGKRAV